MCENCCGSNASPVNFLLDSNIVIGVVNNQADLQESIGNGIVYISAVTVMELYALAGTGVEEERRIDAALALTNILPVTPAIARCAGILSRTRRRNKPDLLIAATALEEQLILVTKNLRDFRSIPELKVQATL